MEILNRETFDLEYDKNTGINLAEFDFRPITAAKKCLIQRGEAWHKAEALVEKNLTISYGLGIREQVDPMLLDEVIAKLSEDEKNRSEYMDTVKDCNFQLENYIDKVHSFLL